MLWRSTPISERSLLPKADALLSPVQGANGRYVSLNWVIFLCFWQKPVFCLVSVWGSSSSGLPTLPSLLSGCMWRAHIGGLPREGGGAAALGEQCNRPLLVPQQKQTGGTRVSSAREELHGLRGEYLRRRCQQPPASHTSKKNWTSCPSTPPSRLMSAGGSPFSQLMKNASTSEPSTPPS